MLDRTTGSVIFFATRSVMDPPDKKDPPDGRGDTHGSPHTHVQEQEVDQSWITRTIITESAPHVVPGCIVIVVVKCNSNGSQNIYMLQLIRIHQRK
jgi:hypothetical protein